MKPHGRLFPWRNPIRTSFGLHSELVRSKQGVDLSIKVGKKYKQWI